MLHRRRSLFHCLLIIAAAVVALLMPHEDAQAFCGFYVSGAEGSLTNDATQVVLMRDGTRTVLSMQNHYDGPPENFAMVVPVPVVLQEENVKTLTHESFTKIDRLAAPRLVEYWEKDPCWRPPPPRKFDDDRMVRSAMPSMMETPSARPAVVIEAQFTVGEYDIVILSANDSMALDGWLRQENYNIPASAEPVLRPYIESEMKFFVAKVNIDKVQKKDGRVVLSPLRFHYDSETFSLPVRLGLLNAKGPQDLIVHILAKNQRYEMANMPNVTIPTNIEVHDDVRTRFGEFYAALYDETLKKNPGAVVTEYSWGSQSCDPCPGPTLDGNDITIFGADVLPNPSDTWGFVLTRLHARYTADELKDDLIFQAAPPIAGGREMITGPSGIEKGFVSAGNNNFQGRYIIRHPWEGKITCSDPIRGRWGGPPAGHQSSQPVAANDTAFAPRGQIQLAQMVSKDIEELGVRSQAPSALPVIPPNSGEAGCGHCSVRQTPTSLPNSPITLLAALAWLGVIAARRKK